MFASQVESFCESSPMKNCNVDLLKYGLNKLKHLPEDYLDAMDPYQRDANKISKYLKTCILSLSFITFCLIIFIILYKS